MKSNLWTLVNVENHPEEWKNLLRKRKNQREAIKPDLRQNHRQKTF